MLWLVYSGLQKLDRLIRADNTRLDVFHRPNNEDPLEFQPHFSCSVMRDSVGGGDVLVNLGVDTEILSKYTGESTDKKEFPHTPPAGSVCDANSCFRSNTTISTASFHFCQRLENIGAVNELADRPEGPPPCMIHEFKEQLNVSRDDMNENKRHYQINETDGSAEKVGSSSIWKRLWTWLTSIFCPKPVLKRLGNMMVKEDVVGGERVLIMPSHDGIRTGPHFPSGCYTPPDYHHNSEVNVRYRRNFSWTVEKQAYHAIKNGGFRAWIPKIIKWKSCNTLTPGDALPKQLPLDDWDAFSRFYISA